MKRLTDSSLDQEDARLSPETLTHFELQTLLSLRRNMQRRKLLRLRETILNRIHQLTREASEETPNYSMHWADAATDTFDRDLMLGLASFEQELLYEIDAALKRIEDGTYGICELTGQPIPWARLKAIPWARFSVGVEKMFKGNMHPHLGELGTVHTD